LPGTTDNALTLTPALLAYGCGTPLAPSSIIAAAIVTTMTAAIQLKAGDPAPEFTLPDADGNPVSLKDFRGQRVIVYFYPAAMTPGCTTQACDFRDSLSALNGAGVAVVGISPDPVEKLAEFRKVESLTFPLLSDPDKQVLNAYGAYGEKNNYGKVVLGVIRSTFVVDADGKIEQAQYNVKATGHVAKLRGELHV
jgi:peroxiredoxin Q/BCP